MSLEQHVGLQTFCKVTSFHQSLETVAAGAFKTIELLRMRGHDDALRQLLEPCTVIGKDIDGVGIAHQRTLGASQLGDDGDSGLFTSTQSRTNTHSGEILGIDSLREGGLLTVELQHSLRHTNLHDHIVALGGMGGHTTSPYPQTSLRSQDGRTTHAVTTGDDQGISHLTLMGKGVTRQDTLADVALLKQRIVGIDLLGALLTQADIQHFQMSD